MILPYINMNLPRVYTCSPPWTLLPPPSPYHPSGHPSAPVPGILYHASNLIAALWIHICTQNIKEIKINLFLWDNWETEKNSKEGCLIKMRILCLIGRIWWWTSATFALYSFFYLNGRSNLIWFCLCFSVWNMRGLQESSFLNTNLSLCFWKAYGDRIEWCRSYLNMLASEIWSRIEKYLHIFIIWERRG